MPHPPPSTHRVQLQTPLPSDEAVAFRDWAMRDAEAVLEACRNAEIHEWTSMPEPSLAAAREWIARQPPDREAGRALHFAVVERASGAVVGNVGFVDFVWKHLRAELGYWTLPRWRGHGFAARAVRLLTDATFAELTIDRIDCFVDPPNDASHRVAKAAGCVYERRLRSYRIYRGRRSDLDSYSRLRDEDGPGRIRGAP